MRIKTGDGDSRILRKTRVDVSPGLTMGETHRVDINILDAIHDQLEVRDEIRALLRDYCILSYKVEPTMPVQIFRL